MLRPTFTRSLYTEDDVFLNLNKTNTDSYIYNTIKSTYDQWYKCISFSSTYVHVLLLYCLYINVY